MKKSNKNTIKLLKSIKRLNKSKLLKHAFFVIKTQT